MKKCPSCGKPMKEYQSVDDSGQTIYVCRNKDCELAVGRVIPKGIFDIS